MPCNHQTVKPSNRQTVKNSVKTFACLSSVLAISMLLVGQAAFAAPFCFQYSDTIITSNTFPAGLSTGDSVKFTMKLDNGGSSLNSQTWTAAHLQSVTYDFKNGTLKTTFNFPFSGGLEGTSGDFVTDGTGTLTAVPSNWYDGTLGTDFTTNGTNTPTDWYLNNGNDKYFTSSPSVGFSVQAGNMVAGNWTNIINTDCPALPAPVSAPIDLRFSKQVETFTTEIEIK